MLSMTRLEKKINNYRKSIQIKKNASRVFLEMRAGLGGSGDYTSLSEGWGQLWKLPETKLPLPPKNMRVTETTNITFHCICHIRFNNNSKGRPDKSPRRMKTSETHMEKSSRLKAWKDKAYRGKKRVLGIY